MMGKDNGQLEMIVIDLCSLVPKNHILKKIEEEINMNIAYRYFSRLDLSKKAPDHSVFSQNRRR